MDSVSSAKTATNTTNVFHNTTCKLYDRDIFRNLIKGIRVSACMISDTPPVSDEASVVRRAESLAEANATGNSGGCSCCKVGRFESRAQQTAHYKHQWHTQNLRRRLLGRPPLTFGEFNSREDDESEDSDSGSDSEDGPSKNEISPLFVAATRHCRAYFINGQGRVLSVYRCLLHHKKEPIGVDGVGERWVEACQDINHERGWAIIMCAGGHFAAAIFRGETGVAVKHKTLHSYVTRRGQGKAQSTRDARGNNAPRSAGASLRRYNQEQFAQHVQEVLTNWKEDLLYCSLILYRAVGPLNKASLFGNNSPIYRKDPRLRTLPFPTRRPSFKEVRRAHDILSTVEIYENVEAFQKAFALSNVNTFANDRSGRKEKKPSPSKLIDRAKSREKNPRPTPVMVSSSEDDGPCYEQPMAPPNWTETLAKCTLKTHKISTSEVSTSDLDSIDENGLSSAMQDINLKDSQNDLDNKLATKIDKKEKENQNKNQKNENKTNKSNKPTKKGVIKVPAIVTKMWTTLSLGNEAFKKYLDSWNGPLSLEEALNISDPSDGNTVLHKAAAGEMPEIVTLLLEMGADPCCRNVLLQTPYCVTNHQETRIAFRFFQGLYPDKYQYAKANIPGPLTPETIEQEKERKAAAKKMKRQKEKEKQLEKVKISKFLELNDKEKIRATVELRCFLCGGSIKGVPFSYNEFNFCNIKCLQNHRNARPLRLSAQ